MASKARNGNGPVGVSGPGYEKDGYANSSQGISAALTAATRGTDGGTWYVYDGTGNTHAVEKRGRVITVLRMGGEGA